MIGRCIRTQGLVFLTLAILCLNMSCSTTHYRKSADRDAYGIIAEKTPKVPGMERDFSIEEVPPPELEQSPVSTEKVEFLGEAAESEVGAHIISLERALELAVKRNRDYQSQKEGLYLAALGLALERHRYAPIFSGTLAGSYNRSATDVAEMSGVGEAINAVPNFAQQVELLAGTPAGLLTGYAQLVSAAGDVTGITASETRVVDERSVSGQTAFGVSVLLEGGAKIALGITSNFLRFLTGDPRANASSALFANITQPLLRGAGSKVAAENLKQAERELLYQLRAFTRYRQDFTVQICSNYYNVLQSRDSVRNNWRSLQSFRKSVERDRAFAAEGKKTQTELGRLEQALLENENNYIGAVRTYKQSLDKFKIDLGMSTDTAIILDDNELVQIKEKGIIHPAISPDDAAQIAKVARLDLYTNRDRVDDSQRKTVVAANALKPGLNIVANATVPSHPENQVVNPDFDHTKWSVGLDTNLPFDRKAERNAYRASLIAYERAKRDMSLAEDRIVLDVRDSWRTLDQARRNYENAVTGVELNARRVEEQALLAELGRATALDQVDAQNSLNAAENNLTAAIVSHTIARLQFWRNMGILFIKENGQWEEVSDVQP